MRGTGERRRLRLSKDRLDTQEEHRERGDRTPAALTIPAATSGTATAGETAVATAGTETAEGAAEEEEEGEEMGSAADAYRFKLQTVVT